MIINSELMAANCENFSKSHGKAVSVLRESNGKQSNHEIAKKLNMHYTAVSGLQKKALKLGLAKKLDNGNYKRLAGVLGWFKPKKRVKNKSEKTVAALISKVKKTKYPASLPVHIFKPSNKIFAKIDKMTVAYSNLYATENALRELIRKVFHGQSDWWKNRVSSGIQKDIQNIISKESYCAAKRKDELEYTHLGQLKEIIISKKNWGAFLPYLNEKNKNAFDVTIDKAIPSRNSIGHCTPLDPSDLKFVDVRFQDILKMIDTTFS